MKTKPDASESSSSQFLNTVSALTIGIALYAISYAALFDRYIFPHVNHGMGGLSYALSQPRSKPLWVGVYLPAVEVHKRFRMNDFYYQF